MGIPPGLQLRIAPSSPRVSSTLGIGSWNPVYRSLSHIRCLVKRKIDHSRLLLFYTFTKAIEAAVPVRSEMTWHAMS